MTVSVELNTYCFYWW